MRWARGWSGWSVLVGVVLVAGLLVAGWVAWWGPSTEHLPTSGPGMTATPGRGMTSNPYVGIYGVTVGVEVTFDEDRVVTAASVDPTVGGVVTVDLYRNDLPDNDAGFPVPQHVPGGVRLSVEATVYPDCASAPKTPPTIVLDSEADGQQLRNTVESVPLEDWRPAVQTWCASGVQASVARAGTRLGDRSYVTLRVVNPGPSAVRVTSAGLRRGAARWWPATVRVPPAASREIRIHGIHTRHLERPTLRMDGEPLTVCGGPEGDTVQLC